MDNYLSKTQTDMIKGILCLMVVFGHSMNGYLEIAGPWAVSVFFLLSGYALSYTSDNAVITPKFIFRKYKKILFPYLVAAVFYHVMFYKYPVEFDYNSIGGLINSYLIFRPTVQAGWYIEVTVIMFFIYFLSKKIAGKSRKKLVIALLICYVIFAVPVAFTASWVLLNSHCFIMGVMLHLFKEQIETKFICRPYFRYMALIVLAVSLLVSSLLKEDFVSDILRFVIFTLSFMVFIYISVNFTFKGVILKFFSKYSLWIYLFHVGVQYFMFAALFPGTSWHPLLFFITSLVLTLIIAVPVCEIYNYISKRIKSA